MLELEEVDLYGRLTTFITKGSKLGANHMVAALKIDDEFFLLMDDGRELEGKKGDYIVFDNGGYFVFTSVHFFNSFRRILELNSYEN